jgi:metal-dependent HD superfamily phosphatase/phosphodiesterase
VDLFDVKLARAAGLYQLDDILEGYRLVKSVLKDFTD